MILTKIIDSLKQGKTIADLVKIKYEHIPLALQSQISKSVMHCSINTDEYTGFSERDFIYTELMTVINVVLECTDIEVEDILDKNEELDLGVAIEAYDEIMKHDIFKYIKDYVKINPLLNLIDDEMTQVIERDNSVARVLKTTIKDLAEKIPSQDKITLMLSNIPSMLSELGGLEFMNPLKSKAKKKTVKKSDTKASKKADG